MSAPPPTLLALAGANPQPLVAHLLDWARRTGRTHPQRSELGTHQPQAVHHLVLAVPLQWVEPTWQALTAASWLAPPTAQAAAPAAIEANEATLREGLHRTVHGQWSITWLVGNPLIRLTQVACQASEVWLAGEHTQAGELAKPIARLCLKGAFLVNTPGADALPASVWQAWQQAGFDRDGLVTTAAAAADPAVAPTAASTHGLSGGMACYAPRWPVPRPTGVEPSEGRHAVVIGAGLAGAALCASLTRRGWQVDLLDQHAGPAEGASALPVGMLSEHVTAQETMLSELSRIGMAWHWAQLQALVPVGAGWQPSQVTNLHRPTTLPAALVRPAALVQAWLDQAQATGLLRTHWHAHVERLHPVDPSGHPFSPATDATVPVSLPLWQVLDSHGQVLAQAPHVVVASAFGSATLLGPLVATRGQPLAQSDPPPALPLRPVKGQMSFGPLTGAPLADHPLRDHGVYVPCYEDRQHPTAQRLWAMGSTYTRGMNDSRVTTPDHERNADSLQAMLPQGHALMAQQLAQGALMGWAQVRCASQDRLPLAGAVPAPVPLHPNAQLHTLARWPGLWTLTALGSRGLTLSLLGAELVVARMLGEPWPLTRHQADALDPARFVLKAARAGRASPPAPPGAPSHPNPRHALPQGLP